MRVRTFKFLEVEPPSPRDERGLPFGDDLEADLVQPQAQNADLELVQMQDEPIETDSAYTIGWNIGYRMLQVHHSYFCICCYS